MEQKWQNTKSQVELFGCDATWLNKFQRAEGDLNAIMDATAASTT
jgi:hypothetical protein